MYDTLKKWILFGNVLRMYFVQSSIYWHKSHESIFISTLLRYVFMIFVLFEMMLFKLFPRGISNVYATNEFIDD
jgi:hypothetical protein